MTTFKRSGHMSPPPRTKSRLWTNSTTTPIVTGSERLLQVPQVDAGWSGPLTPWLSLEVWPMKVMLNDAKCSSPRLRPNARGQGEGQKVEAETEAKPSWPMRRPERRGRDREQIFEAEEKASRSMPRPRFWPRGRGREATILDSMQVWPRYLKISVPET